MSELPAMETTMAELIADMKECGWYIDDEGLITHAIAANRFTNWLAAIKACIVVASGM